jgi:EAL domain-containing protein (putative c-di-GMP-specific phosphodiesterase class I)
LKAERVSGDIPHTYAYQPIVDAEARRVVSYEALLRDPAGGGPAHVLARVPAAGLDLFERRARAKAIRLARALGLDASLNLNFAPATCDPEQAIGALLDAAAMHGLDADRIVVEITEHDVIEHRGRFAAVIAGFRTTGLRFALDDFGAGHSGLNLMVDLQPDAIKIDIHLVRDIWRHGPRQAIVRAIGQAAADLGIDVIAEGIEAADEYRWFRDEGFRLFQGFLIARPALETLPAPWFPQ